MSARKHIKFQIDYFLADTTFIEKSLKIPLKVKVINYLLSNLNITGKV